MKKNELVTQASSHDATTLDLLREIGEALDRIRERAYLRFEARGGKPGASLEDWCEAERELFDLPTTELAETETAYQWSISAPDISPEQLALVISPYSATLLGRLDHRRLFGRVELPTAIEADDVRTLFYEGKLQILMPKVGMSRKTSPRPTSLAA
jgi:HSP20 family molecular chaperone IbpA